METHYCWRCGVEVPMLDESEWPEVGAYLDRFVDTIRAYQSNHPIGLKAARARVEALACAAYERLTGRPEENYLAIYHHRLALHGPPCAHCGRLLRTPRAAFCAACSQPVG